MKATRPSSLRFYVQTFRAARDESDSYNEARENRCKTERAVRRKYDLPEDFDIDPEFWTNPIPASHASYYHKQTQNSRHAGERRVNRQKRRAETYKPSRSSLVLSELADDIKIDEMEVERSRLAEEAEEAQRQMDIVAAEVGYLYFVGDTGRSEAVEYEVERSNRGLVYRRAEVDVHMNDTGAEGEENEERQFSVWEDV
ncbi:hypothetical protein N0V94_002112 [Neodidymelliopsis sp. IMI 364377]|nr:hypothetical protein N0V94_002112 [Neodidymelliopsis sp. IMI 364377]